MSLIHVREKTIEAKIVYYGTALSGKTTSLKHVHRVLDPERRIELVSLNTEGDRTFFFDFLPIPLGSVHGYQLRIQAFTVPGQVKYNLTRRYVLRGADAVIFVADSAPGAFDDNLQSWGTLAENLRANRLDPDRLPILLQYNKRDHPQAVPVERLRAALNARGLPEFPSVATTGEGVFEAFATMCAQMTETMCREYRVGRPDEARETVERRLLAQLQVARPAIETVAPITAELESVDLSPATGVIEVSSADVPDLPDAETLLRHAVETNIESARLVSELNETRQRLADHVRQLAALHQTGVLLASELDTDRLLDAVLQSALRSVSAPRGSVLLFDGIAALRPRVLHGLAEDPLAGPAGPDPDLTARILDRRAFPAELPPDAEGRAGVALVAPLLHQSETLGAIAAYVAERPAESDLQTRLRFLSAVAAQAAVALVNARLYARVESFNRELEHTVAERTRELAAAVEELRALDALKDDFLASMSHELLTPVHSIASAAEILATIAADADPQSAADRAEFTAVVQREAQRLARMMRAVLDLSRVEAGKVEFRVAPVALDETVLGSYERLRGEFKEAGARLRMRVADGLPRVSADAEWIGRVTDALLSNAVKFGGAGEVVVSAVRDGDQVRVDVRDHGPGVDPALADKVFEKFKQAGDVLTAKPAGLGLGLPTARAVLEALGGGIAYTPAPDGGSVFTFRLPVAAAPAADPDEPVARLWADAGPPLRG